MIKLLIKTALKIFLYLFAIPVILIALIFCWPLILLGYLTFEVFEDENINSVVGITGIIGIELLWIYFLTLL